MCPQAASSSPEEFITDKFAGSAATQSGTSLSTFTNNQHASQQAIESPSENYARSEHRLFGLLFSKSGSYGGTAITATLARFEVQQVLSRFSACKLLEKSSIDVGALQYVAHLYNSSLGMDFQVFDANHGVYFSSDGALRRVVEDLQEQGKFKDSRDARTWSRSKLAHFLSDLHQTRPQLESFLLTRAPQNPHYEVTNSNGPRLHPIYIQDIVVPTANRPREVSRLLASLAENFSFFGYNPANIQISVVDTSTNPELRLATGAAVEVARKRGLHVVYVSPEAVREGLANIAKHLKAEARGAFDEIFLRGLFSHHREASMPISIGTVRNAISLLMMGHPYISLDDDMMLDAIVPTFDEHRGLVAKGGAARGDLDLHVGAANDFVSFVSLKQSELSERCTSVPTDFLGITCRNLDAPVYVTESRLVGDADYSPFSKRNGKVSVVRPYLSNASPDVTLFLRNFMQSGDVGELTGAKAPAHVPLDAPASCLFRGYSSGTMFGTSSSAEVPFLDARAYEDVAQSQLTEFFNPRDVQFQGGVIEHRRSVGSRVLNSIQYIDTLIGFYMMSRYLSNTFPDSFVKTELSMESNRERALQRLGRRMYKDGNAGNLSQSDLSNFVDAYLQMGRRLRENKVEGALTFSTKRAQVEAEILSRYRVLLQTNGQLYFFWKKFHAAARQSAEISGF